MSLKQFFFSLCILLITVSISAQVPNTINYQGRLNDASGSPVADNAYLVKFIIYDAPTGGTDLWNTGFQTINTVDGLFTYQLGSNVALSNGIFSDTSRYLGLTVGTDPELTPRSRFISSAYAFEAGNVAWSNISSIPAGFADGTDDEGLSQLGDTLKGTLYFDANADGATEGMIQLIGSSTNLALGTSGNTKSFIWGNTFGEIDLSDIDGDESVRMYAGSTGGTLTLSDTAGLDKIRMFGNYTGNNSVQLPTDAIDNNEILDEPGIAGRLNSTSNIILDQNTTTMTDLVTVTITIPSAGYIYVTGHTLQYTSGTTAANIGEYQIDETSGGGLLSTYYTWAGFVSSPNTDAFYQSVDANRVFFKAAGTYTFRLEALAYYANSASAVTKCYGSKIIAMFFPTSYGSVVTVSSQPPTDDPGAKMISTTDLDGNTHTGYEIDLRNLELKAKEAQLKAKQAELELMKAQQRQSNQNNKQ